MPFDCLVKSENHNHPDGSPYTKISCIAFAHRGKTTIANGLAKELRDEGHSVVVIDEEHNPIIEKPYPNFVIQTVQAARKGMNIKNLFNDLLDQKL